MRYGRQGRRSTRARGAQWLAGGVAAAFLAGALPAVAGAADYCVAPNQTCDAANTVQSFQEALDLADTATDADRVILGAATYTAPDYGGFTYYQAGGPVEVVGQGAGQTILTSPAGGEFVLGLFGGAGTSVQDVTILLPQNAADGTTGLYTNNAARRIEVIEDPTQAYFRSGVELQYGATLEDSSVTLDSVQDTRAVGLGIGGGTVRRSVLSARTGASSGYGGTIERARVTATTGGVIAYGGVTTISGSVIRFATAGWSGIAAIPRPGRHATVNANDVTIVGPGTAPDTSGAFIGNEPAPAESAAINLTNSIIRGVSHPLYADVSGAGLGTIAASYSDYDPSGNVRKGPNATIAEANVSNVGDAGFVDAAGGDYRLLPGSPLIDTGDPATPQALDLDGNPLVADGNADGSARRDPGAFELQPALGQQPAGGGQPGGTAPVDRQRPLISGFRAAPSVFAVARARTPVAASLPRGTRFRYTLSEAAQVRVRIQRVLAGRPTRYRTIGALKRTGAKGPNGIRFTGRIGKRSLRPGRYRAVIAATDAAGNRSTLRSTRFRVAAN